MSEWKDNKQMFKVAIYDDEKVFAEELNELISICLIDKGTLFEIDLSCKYETHRQCFQI